MSNKTRSGESIFFPANNSTHQNNTQVVKKSIDITKTYTGSDETSRERAIKSGKEANAAKQAKQAVNTVLSRADKTIASGRYAAEKKIAEAKKNSENSNKQKKDKSNVQNKSKNSSQKNIVKNKSIENKQNNNKKNSKSKGISSSPLKKSKSKGISSSPLNNKSKGISSSPLNNKSKSTSSSLLDIINYIKINNNNINNSNFDAMILNMVDIKLCYEKVYLFYCNLSNNPTISSNDINNLNGYINGLSNLENLETGKKIILTKLVNTQLDLTNLKVQLASIIKTCNISLKQYNIALEENKKMCTKIMNHLKIAVSYIRNDSIVIDGTKMIETYIKELDKTVINLSTSITTFNSLRVDNIHYIN